MSEEKTHIEVYTRSWDTVSPYTPPSDGDPQSGGNSHPKAAPLEVKGLNLTSGIPTFKTCTWEMSPQNI